MVRTPDEIKAQIISWLKEANVQFDDIQLNETQVNDFEFMLTTKGPLKIHIYILKKLPDRVTIQSELGLAPEHREMVRTMDATKRNALLLNLSNNITLYNVRFRFILDGVQLNGIRIHLFKHDDQLTKDWIIETSIRLQEITNNLINIINLGLGRPPQQPKTTTDEDDSLPYG